MARLPKCATCQKCDEWKGTCDIYPEGIPVDIFVEIDDCDQYVLEETTDDGSYPLATGR